MNHDCSGVGPSVLPLLGMNLHDVARRDRIFMGMGTVDEQMAVRAQRTLMRRFTRGWERQLEGRPSSGAGGQHASGSLCLPGSHLLCLPGSRARRTTVDEVDAALDDKDDEQPPLEGEDLAGVSDCASTVMRERVENLKEPGNIHVLSVQCYL